MGAPGFLEHFHPPRLPPERVRFTHSFCLGGVAFLLFVVLGITGVVLMFSYLPTAQGARVFFSSLEGPQEFLWYFRRVHFIAAQAMVVAVGLHMIRVMATGAHLPPRAINWLVGLGLGLATMIMDLSGYILRWDEPARAAATVVGSIAGSLPWVGRWVQAVLMGGEGLSEATLLRFYVLHCVVLPGLALVGCLYHFWRIRRDGRPTSGL